MNKTGGTLENKDKHIRSNIILFENARNPFKNVNNRITSNDDNKFHFRCSEYGAYIVFPW